MQSATVVNTTDNVKYYWCSQAMNDPNRCTSSNCGSSTYSKTFVNSLYWSGQRDYQFYDADFLSCLPTTTGSGQYQYTYSPSDKTCANNRCQQLCYDTYGSNCASSTAEVSNRRFYTSYCYIFKGECSNSEISGNQGFAERNARIESYGAVYREASATTFFCHEYTRRRALHENYPRYNHQRALALEEGNSTRDDDFDDVTTFMSSLLKTEFADSEKVERMQRKTVDVSQDHYFYD
jgi:hypothetical protein